jgi:hypothetical protein
MNKKKADYQTAARGRHLSLMNKREQTKPKKKMVGIFFLLF